MHAQLTAKPTDAVISAIRALDLESVKSRVMDQELGEGWSREYAESVDQAYRHYLAMLVKYPEHAEDIMLSKDVDEFWHTHILQTVKYADDCQAVFGNFLHHDPHIGPRTPADLEKRAALADKTRRLYEQEFGAQNADAAWAGDVGKSETAAYSAARIPRSTIAYSAASIVPRQAAYSAAKMRVGGAAYSAARIVPQAAAYSAAKVRAESAAYSAAKILAGDAAYSAARIVTQAAAYSAAKVRPESAAYSAAKIATDAAVSA